MKRALIATLAVLLSAGPARPAAAYLKFGFQAGGRTLTLRWPGQVRYFIRDAGVPEVSPSQLQAAVTRAFATWQDVPTASIAFEFAGFTSGAPFQSDGMSVVGFQNRPELERVLGATNFTIDTRTGEITESDIFLNSRFDWSVAPGGEPGRYDLQTIATHEAGHLIGLGHSLIGETELRPEGGRRVVAAEAVMFPIAFGAGNISGRELRADDIAGVSDLYPAGDVEQRTGAMTGRVLSADGRGLQGAHVVAASLETGKLVSNFSLSGSGEFTILRLEPGPYVVRVEPLDDAEIDSFFDPAMRVDIDFRATFYERVVVVPRGGTPRAIEIRVAPK